jgi:alpha-2-macroglobulin-like protein
MESVTVNRPVMHAVLASFCAGLLVVGSLMLGGQAAVPTPQLVVDLSGYDRYLTHVSTDKPIYRTGELLYVRSVVLRAEGHTPLTLTNPASIEIRGPKGDIVASGFSTITDSVMGFSWNIPTGQAGGEYTVRVSNPFTGDAPAVRKFDIRAYRAPRLKSQIVFVRDGYGPGDTVAANLHVDRAEGGIPAGAKVSVTALVDGKDAWKGETTVDAAGNASASFKLPTDIARGEGTLAMVIQDGGTVETASKTIPILLQTLDLEIYPEGGDIVAGLPNRIYVEGRTPAQKPADMAGVIVNSAGREVANFRTEHEGRGRFAFTPARGESYSLRVTEPAGIKTIFPLPAVKESGVVISSTADVTPRQKNVVLRVAATVAGEYVVSLSQRGKELSTTSINLRANQPSEVTFTVPKSLDGVIIATVYDDRKTPRAERLLFRQPERNIRIHVAAENPDYVPGDRVTLRVTTTDDNDKPVGTMVGLTVTDSSVLEMIEKREQAPRLPVMVLLENDVKNLSDAHVYLDETNPKAPLATDLLLGTQGWRRFATVDVTNFLAANGDAGRRALAITLQTDADRARAALLTPRVAQEARAVAPGVGRGAGGGIPGGVVGGVVGGVPRPVPGPPAPPAPAPAAVRGAAAAVGEVLDAERARNLPLMGGNVLDLLAILPADMKKEAAGLVARDQANQNLARNGLGQAAAGGGRGAAPAFRNDFIVVREYAHTLRPNWTAGSRSDFAETVYWNAGVKTDASTGVAIVSFNLSDSVTSFKVLADGFASDGTLGSGDADIESVQPFFIEPKLPLQVTSGDRIQLPISMVNGMNRELTGVQLSPRASAALIFGLASDNNTTLRAKERVRRILSFETANEFSGMADLVLDAGAGLYRDTVTRKLDVQPLGFPFESSKGGVLESNGSSSFEFSLPVETMRGSITASVVVYPTPLASMTEALQALLRQPNGCFEQTSSTSYPMVMAQQYFITHAGIDPGIVEKTKTLLETSYKRLTGFESPKKGYEWFGADPGHEALTAYGLMQFTDMSRVRDVDKEMIQRTRAWLMARRDGNGGFNRSAKAIDSFGGAPQDTTDAYITWALVESGEQGLEKEIAHVKAVANATQDSYIIALAANILNTTGDKAGARLLMDKLAKNQDIAGNVKSAVASITRSGGDALAIETTALSALAWISEPSYAGNLEKGVRWIVESNKNGRFASTQSTILALRAIVSYDAARARPKAPGRIVLSVDGKVLGSPIAFTADTQGAITVPVFGSDLGVGKHTMVLRMEDGSSMPFSMSVKYFSTLPDNSPESQIGIEVSLKDREVQEGGITEARVSVVNKSNQVIPTPVAIVGIPGGLEVRHDQLKELVKSGKIDAYEVIGREVVLYWRYMKPNDKVELPLSLVAAIPGVYTGPASRAYLYYTDEFKNWAPGLKVTIAPRL